MTTYYPTAKGMEQTQKKGFDPSSDSGAYMYNELMSKPWTQEQYFHEHLGSGPKQGWGGQQNLAETIWKNSVRAAFISDNPQDSFYSSHRAIDSMGNVHDLSTSNPYDDPGVIGYDLINNDFDEDQSAFSESQVCDICGKYKWQEGHNH
tara:strand:+ start:162 stop:608 length:447 start_codon:yes stop_codon:yes gene_type:complete